MLYYLIGRQIKNNHSHFRKINMANRLIVRSFLWLPLIQSSRDKATSCPLLLSSFSHTSNTRCILPSLQEKGHVHQEHWLQQLQKSQLKHCNSQKGHVHQEHWLQCSHLEHCKPARWSFSSGTLQITEGSSQSGTLVSTVPLGTN